MKTILVPTDFSDHALYAQKVAASIAHQINAEIKLVHVYDLPLAEFADQYYYEKFYKQIKTDVQEKLNALVEMDILKGIKVSTHIVSLSLIHI